MIVLDLDQELLHGFSRLECRGYYSRIGLKALLE